MLGSMKLCIPYSHDQTPQLLFISSINLVRLLFESSGELSESSGELSESGGERSESSGELSERVAVNLVREQR